MARFVLNGAVLKTEIKWKKQRERVKNVYYAAFVKNKLAVESVVQIIFQKTICVYCGFSGEDSSKQNARRRLHTSP